MLQLDIASLTKPGRKPAPIAATFARALVLEDLSVLGTNRGTEAPNLTRVTERHHALARMLALGTPPGEAAAALGYTASRVSILKGSPAFQELLVLYSNNKDAAFADAAAQLSGLSTDAILEIRDRLEEDEDRTIPLNQLIEIAKMAADRSGNGPSSKVEQNVNINLAERLEAARKRHMQTAIDVTPVEPQDG